MKPIWALIILYTLVACASTPYEMRRGLNLWLEQDIDSLLSEWGTPSSVFQSPTGNLTIYKYIYTGNTQIFIANGQYFSKATASQNYCFVEFIVDEENFVTDYRWEGSCKLR